MNKPVWKTDWMIGLLITLLFLLLSETSQMRSLDWYAYDLGMRFTSDKTANEDIVVIGIDDKSIQALGAWPWSRDVIAKSLRQLSQSRPDVIGLTMPLDARQNTDTLESLGKLREVLKSQKAFKSRVRRALATAEANLNIDQRLASILHDAGRIVLAIPYVDGPMSASREEIEFPDYLRKFTVKNIPETNLPGASQIFPPIELFSDQVGGVGIIRAHANRSIHAHHEPLIVKYGDVYLPSFALMMTARNLGLLANHIKVNSDQVLELGGRLLNSDQNFFSYPRYYKGEDDQAAFKTFSFIDLFNGEIHSSELRHKTIIIGLTSTQHASTEMTPIGEAMTPTLMAAHSVSSLLNDETFRIPNWAPWVQKAAIVLIGLYLMLVIGRLRKATAFFVSVFLLLIMINSHFIFMNSEAIWLPVMAAVMTLITGHLILGSRLAIASHFHNLHQALSDANRQIGQSLQTQGHLDQAFEKYRQCEINDTLLDQLYNLGLDYERKRQFNKAESVFKYIQSNRADYSDVAVRIEQNKNAIGAMVLGGSPATNGNITLVSENGGIQKPMLGRYLIDKEIGRGAMGMVYLGHDDKIGRTVAIKTMVMREEIEVDKRDEVKARFFREAEAAGRLDHPNIVTVYDVGDEQDLAYIAMDYLKGKDLNNYCRVKKLLPPTEVFEVIISIAEALDYAHEQHVVHRDIKPANIIYNKAKKIAKITDFGVACLTDASKTKTGTVLGSPYYMSPEQLAGQKVDGRSDIYSLGVTLYQMLVGELPFTSDSMANLMYKIANEKHRDIRSFRPELPSCVSNIVNRALHKVIEKRFQSGKQMAASMRRCSERLAG